MEEILQNIYLVLLKTVKVIKPKTDKLSQSRRAQGDMRTKHNIV